MNTLVNIEILHLLKDKSNLLNYTINKDESISFHNIPEIGDVVMWLYEKHSIWIEVTVNTIWVGRKRDLTAFYNAHTVSQNRNYKVKCLIKTSIGKEPFTTPTKAYSEAIIYSLNNLICK